MSDVDHYAEQAARLLNDDTLIEASKRLQGEALAALIEVDANDTTAVIRLQVRAQMATEILTELAAMITASGQHDGGVAVENKPTA